MTKPIILTGIRANNDLHIGNYFGAILPIIDMAKTRADEFQVNLFIPDLHSFTTPIDHGKLQEQILQAARLFAAAGLPLDNDNIHIYRQSYVPAHSELTWILDCFTGFGQMSRMTQFKDKSAGKDDVSVGLFNYPVLMAADILLYGASYVPVGDDQTQHLEYTRDIAERMNSRFGELFVVPEPVIKQHEFFGKDQGLRIKDLQNPDKKMSKSDDTGKGVIFLGDDPEVAAKKIMSAATDDQATVRYSPVGQPGISNLLQILGLLRGGNFEELKEQFVGMTQYGEFKKIVAEEVRSFLVDFQAKLSAVDDVVVMQKLASSETTMNTQANQTLLSAQQAVGLRPRA
ncbi:MAG TPA: tryptophan--tRNA ligase [Candidatus Saccharimonadales bacterium]